MESTKYRRKPLVVDAIQWDGQVRVTLGQAENERTTAVKIYTVCTCDACEGKPNMGLLWAQNDCEIIHSGDYIVLDADGQFSRVDRAAFEALYEACPEVDPACIQYDKALSCLQKLRKADGKETLMITFGKGSRK